ncbi:hypothetical protein BGZ68_007532 [Mortierella alpina]|nr:hypothetical protein BGZ68_007532 [Mortierella alpina]
MNFRQIFAVLFFLCMTQAVTAGTYWECVCYTNGSPHFPGVGPTYNCGVGFGCHYNSHARQKSWFAKMDAPISDFTACCARGGKVGFCRKVTGFGLC